MKTKLLLIAMGLTLVLVLTACSAALETAQKSVLPLERLDGTSTDIVHFEGQVVIVNFWATWCGPCRVEMPELQAYYEAHMNNPDFAMLAVNRGETADTARQYVEDGEFTFPVVLDKNDDVANWFGGVRGMPTTFVLDRNGEVIWQHIGALNRDLLEQEVTPLLDNE